MNFKSQIILREFKKNITQALSKAVNTLPKDKDFSTSLNFIIDMLIEMMASIAASGVASELDDPETLISKLEMGFPLILRKHFDDALKGMEAMKGKENDPTNK